MFQKSIFGPQLLPYGQSQAVFLLVEQDDEIPRPYKALFPEDKFDKKVINLAIRSTFVRIKKYGSDRMELVCWNPKNVSNFSTLNLTFFQNCL